jgi:hypothetical protein
VVQQPGQLDSGVSGDVDDACSNLAHVAPS